MTVGLASALTDAVLNLVKSTGNALTAGQFAITHVEPHTADPGASGTAGQTGAFGTAPQRVAVTWAASITAGPPRSISTTGTADWPTAVSGAVITHLSGWSASTGGTFRLSAVLTTSRTVGVGDVLRFNSLTFSLVPTAA